MHTELMCTLPNLLNEGFFYISKIQMGITGITRKKTATVLAKHLKVKQQYRGGINRLFIVRDLKVHLVFIL